MGALFGTDGIRGVAGKAPLDSQTVFQMGVEFGGLLKQQNRHARVVVGRDTRASGPWIEKCLVDGLAGSGVTADVAGIFTTPGVSFLARSGGYQAGVVISASHNPWEHNGIKIFAENGMKLSDATEEQIEARVSQTRAAPPPAGPEIVFSEAMLGADPASEERYRNFLCAFAAGTRVKFRIAVDCANGAAFRIGPEVLRALGHDVVVIHDRPNGFNINVDSGALQPEVLCRTVRSCGADFGVAFDGDADRSIFVDEQGRVVDGDHILYLLALHLKAQGRLQRDRIVSTSMANMGLEVALREAGIGMERTQVGDRYVLEHMLDGGLNLGGEQSGHILLLDRSVAGDGIITTIELIHALQAGAVASVSW